MHFAVYAQHWAGDQWSFVPQGLFLGCGCSYDKQSQCEEERGNGFHVVVFEVRVKLNHHQGIAVSEEPVFLFDGLVVRFHGQFMTGKRSSGHQQGALWRVEIGDERVGNLKLELGINELVGPTFERLERLCGAHGRFKPAK